MPTSAQHGERVKRGLAFLANAENQTSSEQLTVEYFYSCLHMLEAAIFDFTKKPKTQHYFTHGGRTEFLKKVLFDTKSPFFGLKGDYEALRELSEQGRYLSPAGSETYEPLLPNDLDHAKQLHLAIKKLLEDQYIAVLGAGAKAPWL